jgi:hypothetical protein
VIQWQYDVRCQQECLFLRWNGRHVAVNGGIYPEMSQTFLFEELQKSEGIKLDFSKMVLPSILLEIQRIYWEMLSQDTYFLTFMILSGLLGLWIFQFLIIFSGGCCKESVSSQTTFLWLRTETVLTEIQTCCSEMNNFYETLKEIVRSCEEHMNGVILIIRQLNCNVQMLLP